MPRFLFLLLLAATSLGWPAGSVAQSTEGLPPRPTPFQFVTDQGQLLAPADANTLESGLRRYADNTGTQIVVVTVPSLNGRDVADYGRALGQSWGIGQRGKNNGVVILLGAQDHKVTIQAGSGLRSQLTPAVTARVINEQMTPSFKQGRYFAGLRAGLNTLMLAANPSSDPRQNAAGTPAPAATPGSTDAAGTTFQDPLATPAATPEPAVAPVPAAEPASPGLGFGTLAIGGVLLLGAIWLISRLFRRRNAATTAAPDFLPSQPNRPNQPGGNYRNPGYGNQPGPDFLPGRNGGSSGSGMGNVLMTGAAAAAGAYLGNRMANGSDNDSTTRLNSDAPLRSPDADVAATDSSAGGFPFLGNSGSAPEEAPDYFSSDSSSDSPDYFSSDNDSSSYDDTSSGDTGGGGFDDDNSNSGSW